MKTNLPVSKLHTEQRKLVLLPIGSCEQHGPHLPVDTDLRIAQLIADELTHTWPEEQVLLLPAIPFSCSWEHKGTGTIALRTSSLSAVLYDVAVSLKNWKTSSLLVLINWHGGNSALSSIATEITALEDIPTTVIPAITLAGPIWKQESGFTFSETHAGAMETSIIQAYWPELVDSSHLKTFDFIPDIEPVEAQSAFQALGMYAVSQTGVWGRPGAADPKTGKIVLTTVVREISEQIHRLMELLENTRDWEEK